MTKETRYKMQHTRCKSGFTLVELLVALVVVSIVLTAVATLAFAMRTATDVTDDTSSKQAQVRFATLRISELIRHCRLICGTPGRDLAIWRADDNGDGQLNINELTYISAGRNRDHIRLYECNNISNPIVELTQIDSVGTSWWLGFYDVASYAELIAQCSNVQLRFLFDSSDDPVTKSRFVSISFDLVENDFVRQYQINTAIGSWAGNLLSADGQSIVADDD
jgi:prepilin-type N-terminal cleavage/methylation domain-containing protein